MCGGFRWNCLCKPQNLCRLNLSLIIYLRVVLWYLKSAIIFRENALSLIIRIIRKDIKNNVLLYLHNCLIQHITYSPLYWKLPD